LARNLIRHLEPLIEKLQSNINTAKQEFHNIASEIETLCGNTDDITAQTLDLLHNLFYIFSALIIAQTSFVRNKCRRRRFR
jgi:hypothetical protein